MASNLFIALGGTGYKVISELQKSFASFRESRNETDDNKYLYIDTDQVSVGKHSKSKNTEIINLGPFKVLDHYNDKRGLKAEINKWFDGDNIIVPQTDLSEGAKGTRQLSRMGYYYHPDVQENVKKLLRSFKTDNENALKKNKNNLNVLKIYVVSGTAGGTGSGILTDLLYTMWRFYIDDNMNGNLDICGLLLMPNHFLSVRDDQLKKKYMLNGYAFIQETNALVRLGLMNNVQDQFHNFLTGQYTKVPTEIWQPYQKAVLVDNSNRLFDFTDKYLYEIISEFLFSFTLGKSVHGDKQVTGDNTVKSIQELLDSALTNAEPDMNLEYVNFFSSFGMLVLKSANEYFSQYTTARLKYDVYQSISGKEDIFSNDVFNSIRQNIEHKYNDFAGTHIQAFALPKIRSKEARKELFDLMVKLDFNKPIPAVNDKELHQVTSQLNTIKSDLSQLTTQIKDEIFILHEQYMRLGNSLNCLINVFYQLDREYYNLYDSEKNKKINADNYDFKDVLETKMNQFFFYQLSKGDEKVNDKGILDLISIHLKNLRKEINQLIDSVKEEIQAVACELEERKRNKALALVPDAGKIVSRKNDMVHFHSEGPFVIWYNDIQFDIAEIQKNVIAKVFHASNSDYQFIVCGKPFNSDKFKKSIFTSAVEQVTNALNQTSAFQQQMKKTIYDLINEASTDSEDAVKYFKDFSFPFIKLIYPKNAERYVFAGFFGGNQALKERLGYDETNPMNHILIDEPYFSDRIIKIAFHNKIRLDDYFLFDTLKDNYKTQYQKLRKENKSVASPFIHKDLAGDDFDGDVYKLLLRKSQGSQQIVFNNYSEPIKQLIYKFGLLYIYEYIEKGVTSGIFKSDFKKSIISYNKIQKQISLLGVSHDDIIGEDIINNAIVSKIITDPDAGPINYQGEKSKIHSVIKYFIDNKKTDLDDTNTIDAAIEAYKKFMVNDQAFRDNFGPVFNTFFDAKNKKIIRPFIEFYHAIFI